MKAVQDRVHVLMILESHFPALAGGGAEAQLRTLAGGLKARGHRVTILAPLSPLGPQKRISRVDGIAVCRLSYPRLRFVGGPILWFRLMCFLLAHGRRYDAWHAHIAHRLAPICAVVGERLGIPVVVKIAGSWEARNILAPSPSPVSKLAYLGLLRATAVQAISQRIAGGLAERGVPRNRVVVIPNAVDTRRFRDITPSDSPYLRFLFLGRLVPQKGLDTLLECFARALGTRPYAQLRIVGDGPMLEVLQSRSRALGLGRRVCFEGHRSDVEDVLANADVAILPSRIEGLSNTLLECMAAGLPMIASRISGSEDLVRHGDNGWLFEPDDRSGLMACLVHAATVVPARRLEMGQRARQHVDRHAGMDSVIDRLLVIYRGRDPQRRLMAQASQSAGDP